MNSENNYLYEYAVVRYVPSIEREEFINIGLIMMCKRKRWICFRYYIDYERFKSMKNVCHTIPEIENQLGSFVGLCRSVPEGQLASAPVEERFRWLTAVRSASLSTSRPHPGKTNDLEATFSRLFNELVC